MAHALKKNKRKQEVDSFRVLYGAQQVYHGGHGEKQQSIPALWRKYSGKPHTDRYSLFDKPDFNQAQNSPAHFKPINTHGQKAVNPEDRTPTRVTKFSIALTGECVSLKTSVFTSLIGRTDG